MEIRADHGFTLIELLVVIAIIAILASIVMANIGSSRDAARDVSIENAIREAAQQSQIFYDDFGDYNQLCNEPEFVAGGLIEGSISTNGGSFACGSTVNGFCFSSTLNKGGSVCVDGYYEQKSGFVCDNTGTDIVCD